MLPHHQLARPLVPVGPSSVASALEEHLPQGCGAGCRGARDITQAGVRILLGLRSLSLALGHEHHGDRVVRRAFVSRREWKLPLDIAAKIPDISYFLTFTKYKAFALLYHFNATMGVGPSLLLSLKQSTKGRFQNHLCYSSHGVP